MFKPAAAITFKIEPLYMLVVSPRLYEVEFFPHLYNGIKSETAAGLALATPVATDCDK